jgi:hypothetical protein
MGKQLLSRRTGFLAQTRNYPIFGLRLLGGDVSSDRTTREMFGNMRLRKNADGVEIPIFMSWYWNRLWDLGKLKHPTKRDSIEASRILSVLSFSKMLVIDSKKARQRAMNDYSERIKNRNGRFLLEMTMRDDEPLYVDMVKFLNRYGSFNQGKRFKFDRRSYSLKPLVGKKPYRPPVPPAYGYPSAVATLIPYDENGSLKPNNLVNVINRFYYDKEAFDARLCIIAEPGGKYRGICPYTSPYAHSVNLYHRAKSVLNQIPGNCNYDQAAGHIVGRRMSCNNKLKISADASNFTDTINVEYAAYMAKALGSSGAVHYHSRLRIKDFDGKVLTGCVPLMGWKGTFDLASVLLSYSFWRERSSFPKGKKVQCGDDYLGYGKLEDYQRAYEFIGCKLSKEKTIVSRTVTVFCGKMFWRGLEVTPVRLLMAGYSDRSRFIGKILDRARDFALRCNYSRYPKRKIFRFLKKHLGSRYKGYLDFRLSSDLGGVPLYLGPRLALVPYLENNIKALKCALCNIPYESEDFDGYTTHFSHLPLGKPYSKLGQSLPLTPGSWPTKRKLVFSRRRRKVNELLSTNRASIADVLLYIYDGTVLKP